MQATVKSNSYTIELVEDGVPRNLVLYHRDVALQSYGLLGYRQKITVVRLRDPKGQVIAGEPDLPKAARVA